jgi:UDP-hydrolysing UDP-N-acetyl-D-glucosamine 2-epimerase
VRRIGVITTGRADYGIYLPLLKRIQADPELSLLLFVSGTHLNPAFDETVSRIENDGFPTTRIPIPTHNITARDTACGIGETLTAFAKAYDSDRPDILIALGDRHEMLGAVTASVPYNIPVAHIHGGEVTEGAIDEVFRHAITKMSHLHFAATEAYGKRIVRMGEEPWRVNVCGAPSLDNLSDIELFDLEALSERLNFSLDPPPLLVTYHPVTTELETTHNQLDALFAGLNAVGTPIIFTAPNADSRSGEILDRIKAFVGNRLDRAVYTDLGTQVYFSLMKHAAVMVGNSSSGIIEAASFALPVVNIGSRQRGRDHGPNVVHVDTRADDIESGILEATSEAFERQMSGTTNPYGDGHASDRILSVLKKTSLTRELVVKRFYDGDERDAA